MIASTFDPQVFFLGALAVLCGFVLFAGSGYVLLSGVLGARMAYLVEATAFFAFLALLSSLWTFGFWAGGPDTQANQGPRGTEPGWVVVESGVDVSSAEYPEAALYPGEPWKEPNEGQLASVDPLAASMREYAAAQANEQAGIEVQAEIPKWAGGQGEPEYELGKQPYLPTDFVVQNVRFATQGDTSLGAGEVHYKFGGPLLTTVARHDPGHPGIWSWVFLIGSLMGFAIHVPFLDKEEKRRKGIITSAPAPWRSGA
jgi:hypothetical protein